MKRIDFLKGGYAHSITFCKSCGDSGLCHCILFEPIGKNGKILDIHQDFEYLDLLRLSAERGNHE
jgi:hypothetical protein